MSRAAERDRAMAESHDFLWFSRNASVTTMIMIIIIIIMTVIIIIYIYIYITLTRSLLHMLSHYL